MTRPELPTGKPPTPCSRSVVNRMRSLSTSTKKVRSAEVLRSTRAPVRVLMAAPRRRSMSIDENGNGL